MNYIQTKNLKLTLVDIKDATIDDVIGKIKSNWCNDCLIESWVGKYMESKWVKVIVADHINFLKPYRVIDFFNGDKLYRTSCGKTLMYTNTGLNKNITNSSSNLHLVEVYLLDVSNVPDLVNQFNKTGNTIWDGLYHKQALATDSTGLLDVNELYKIQNTKKVRVKK